MKIIPVIVALIAVFAFPYASSASAPTPEQLAESWSKNCSKCHGADGAGKTKAGRKLRVRDYTLPAVQAEMKDAEMLEAIKAGVKKDGEEVMESYADKLSAEEIEAFIGYIRSFKK